MTPTTSCWPTKPSPMKGSKVSSAPENTASSMSPFIPAVRKLIPMDTTPSTPAIHSSVLFFSGTRNVTMSPNSEYRSRMSPKKRKIAWMTPNSANHPYLFNSSARAAGHGAPRRYSRMTSMPMP